MSAEKNCGNVMRWLELSTQWQLYAITNADIWASYQPELGK